MRYDVQLWIMDRPMSRGAGLEMVRCEMDALPMNGTIATIAGKPVIVKRALLHKDGKRVVIISEHQ